MVQPHKSHCIYRGQIKGNEFEVPFEDRLLLLTLRSKWPQDKRIISYVWHD